MKLEYALLLALIASVIVIAITHTSHAIASPFEQLQAQLSEINASQCNTAEQKSEPESSLSEEETEF